MDIIISLFVVVLTSIVYWCLSKQFRRPNEPPLSFGLPFIGEGISFIASFGNLVARLRKKYGSIVTVVVFGQRMHFLTDSKSIRKIWSMPDLFSFEEFAFGMEVNLSGIEPHMKPSTEPIRFDLLRGVDVLNNLAIRFRDSLMETIKENPQFRQKEFEKFDLREFTSNFVFAAAGRSLFGRTWLKGTDLREASHQFNVFESQILLIANGLPKFCTKKGCNARDYLAREVLLPQIQEGGLQGAQSFVPIMIRDMSALYDGKKDDDMKKATRLMGLLFGVNSNTINSLFWVLARIYLADEQVRIDLRKEIESAKPLTSCSYMETKRQMPLMNSIILEVFRLHSFPSSVRVAQENCTIKDLRSKDESISFRKGDFVFALPLFEQFKGLQDKNFNPRRWMKYTTNPDLNHKNLPLPHDELLLPFGGGKHLCPGRFFAMLEMHLMISFCFEHYDIELNQESILPPSIQGAVPMNIPTKSFPVRIRYNANN